VPKDCSVLSYSKPVVCAIPVEILSLAICIQMSELTLLGLILLSHPGRLAQFVLMDETRICRLRTGEGEYFCTRLIYFARAILHFARCMDRCLCQGLSRARALIQFSETQKCQFLRQNGEIRKLNLTLAMSFPLNLGSYAVF
jgi:hypothetical protein